MNKQEAIKIFQYGSQSDILEYLNDLDTAFDTYNRNIANSDEVINTLINFALISKDDEITDELLEVICSAQRSQDLRDVDYSKIATNLNNVPEKFLPRYIDILSYSYDTKYLPTIVSLKKHKNKEVQQAVEDALKELQANEMK